MVSDQPSVLNTPGLNYTVQNQGPYIAAGVVGALLMGILLVMCVGVPVCYCGWIKGKASE